MVAGLYKAKQIAEILSSSVHQKLRFFTESNESGHLVISESSTQRILDELAQGGTVILKSPMGTGKTERVIRRAMEGATRAAHVLPRVSVVNDAAKRLSLDHYQNVDEIMAHFTQKMVACVNSMGATRFISNGVNWFENLDMLCLDEASQIFAQVTLLGRMERRRENHDALLKAMKSARSVLIADADANEYLVEELRRMAPERKITLIEIEHKEEAQKRWDIHFTDSMTQVRSEFIKAAVSGERCLLATDNRRKGIELERALEKLRPGIRILNIHRESSEEGLKRIRSFYLDPSGESQKYDVLIYSPAITSGVSLTTQHFTRHFGIFTGVVKVNDIIQMLGRDRTAKKWVLAVCPRAMTRRMQYFESGLESLGETPTLFSHLKFATDQFEVDARDNLIVLAINILKLKGHRVHMAVDMEQKYDRALGRLMKSISEDLTNERLERILSQAEISESEYFALKSLWMPTAEEAAAITAHRIRNELCADLTVESLDFFDKGGLKKLALLETLLAEDTDLRRFDNNEKISHDPSLRYHALEKKKLLLEVLGLLTVDSKTMLGEFTHSDCQKVVELCLSMHAKVNVLFGDIIDPARPPRCATKFVQKLLGLLGLTLGSRKSNGHMIRFIDKTELQSIMTHVRSRLAKQRSFIRREESELLAA